MPSPIRNRLGFVLFALLGASHADTLVLSSAFVDTIKDKVTVTIQLEVDAHPERAHGIATGGDDGDIHMAGRANEIRLPLVAEILNAADDKQKSSMTALKGSTPTKKIAVSGVWRLWFEHPSSGTMVQGDPVSVPDDPNPDHVFEIHPITQFAGISLLDSFVPIAHGKKTYQAYSASKAFPSYEKLSVSIKSNTTALTLTSKRAVLNYAEFIIELAAKPTPVADGSFVLAKVFDVDDEEEPVVSGLRRMVFVKGTQPDKEVKTMHSGDRLRVLGIPRINLSEALALVQPGKTVNSRLPYEMIIVAVMPE